MTYDLVQPRFPLRSHYLVCIENHLFIVGIGPTLNKDLGFIFRSNCSDCMCAYTQVSVQHEALYILRRNAKCIVKKK